MELIRASQNARVAASGTKGPVLLTVEMVVGVALHLIVTIVTSQLAVLIARHVVIAAGVAKTKNALQLRGSGEGLNDF